MQVPGNDSIFKNLFVKDKTNTDNEYKYYTTDYSDTPEGGIAISAVSKEQMMKGKNPVIVDLEYLKSFNPNENHPMHKVFLPLWLRAMGNYSFEKGLLSQLRKHQRSLELQQVTEKELETDKSNTRKEEKKS